MYFLPGPGVVLGAEYGNVKVEISERSGVPVSCYHMSVLRPAEVGQGKVLF